MTEFKIGDKVRLISNPARDQTVGDIGEVISPADCDGEFLIYYENGVEIYENPNDIEYLEKELVTIKTETKIKPSVYGLLELFSHDDHEVTIELRYTTAQAKDLRETANVLNEIATILEGQKK